MRLKFNFGGEAFFARSSIFPGEEVCRISDAFELALGYEQ